MQKVNALVKCYRNDQLHQGARKQHSLCNQAATDDTDMRLLFGHTPLSLTPSLILHIDVACIKRLPEGFLLLFLGFDSHFTSIQNSLSRFGFVCAEIITVLNRVLRRLLKKICFSFSRGTNTWLFDHFEADY